MTQIVAVAALDAQTLADPLSLLRRCRALGVWAVEFRLDFLPDQWLPEALRDRPTLPQVLADGRIVEPPSGGLARWFADTIKAAWRDPLAVRHGLPRLIATARKQSDGGHFRNDADLERVALLQAALDGGADIVDVELELVDGSAEPAVWELVGDTTKELLRELRLPGDSATWRLILSYHGETAPMELDHDDVLRPTRAEFDAAIMEPRIASRVKDALEAAIYKHATFHRFPIEPFQRSDTIGAVVDESNRIWIPGDDYHVWTRGVADIDRYMTHVYLAAPLHDERLPQLPGVERLRRHAGLRPGDNESRPTPTVIGAVAGIHVQNSLSPLIHPALYVGIAGTFRYMALRSKDFSAVHSVLAGWKYEWSVLSITNPLKERVLAVPYTKPDDMCREIGAANTMIGDTKYTRTEQRWTATNTDAGGFMAALEAVRPRTQLRRDRVLVLGYGGTARAVLYALRGVAGEVVVHGRDAAKGREVASRFSAAWHPDPTSDDFPFDVIVNCTPCGQPGGPLANESPIDLSRVPMAPGALVHDLVYGQETPLIRQAKQLGVASLDGITMLIQQAILQQEWWGLAQDLPRSGPKIALIEGACRRACAGMPWTPPIRIALIGYRGVGKTTVLPLLAGRLGVSTVDLDQEVAAAAGMPASEAFRALGEDAYRELEAQCLSQWRNWSQPKLLATGGGVVENAKSLEYLAEGFTVIWLRAKPETLLQRLETGPARPGLGNASHADDIAKRLPAREPWYEAIADLTVETDGKTPEQVAEEVAGWLLYGCD